MRLQNHLEKRPQQQPQEQPLEEEPFPEPPAKPARPHNFNRQEAYEDSSSESARYLDSVEEWRDNMDEYNSLKAQYETALVRERLDGIQEERDAAVRQREAQIQQSRQLQQIDNLMQGSYGMSANESKDFITKMSDPKSITVDNLVKLYRLEQGQGAPAPANTGQPAQPSSTFQQAQRAQQVPQPMGVQPTAGNHQAPAEDQIMDKMISDFKDKNPW
jgi:hypothetical protein